MNPLMNRTCPVCQTQNFRPLFTHGDRLHGLPGTFTVIACADCGLISYDPLLGPEALARYYPPDYYAHQSADHDAQAGGGLRRLVDDLHLGVRRNPLLAILFWPLLWYKETYSYARFLRPLARGRLLDVGCGDGAFLLKARRMGFECSGLEPGGTAARGLAATGIPVHGCTLEELGPAHGPYDVITLNHVFEHLSDPEGALRKLAALLAPAGRLLVRMPDTHFFFFRHWPRHCLHLETPRHVFLYHRDNFTRLARRCGLEVVAARHEAIPTHLQLSLKGLLFKKLYGEPHWSDSRLISFALLPFCAGLRWIGQGDSLALWLRRADRP